MRAQVFLVSLACLAFAQVPTGEIRLDVHDPAGAPMQASGRLANTAINRPFQTDSLGNVRFTALPYGRYRLDISGAGFAPQSIFVELQSPVVSRRVNMSVATAAFAIDVVGTTPLPGVELARDEIPAQVQAASQLDIERSGAADLSAFLNRRLNGVNINEMQGNPFQPDVNYRGYTASPLLGTPQGLSVYVDGVRQNQPFGDVVSWDLIPRMAIAEVTLMPGSNPLFGLNTLGGALLVQTKDGHTNPGASVQASGGSFGRRETEGAYGGASGKGLSWFLAGHLFGEDGWRIASPTTVRQVFGRVGWQRANTALDLSFSGANNSLSGNGLQEQRLLAQNYASVYTKPDITADRAGALNLTARHSFNNKLIVAGNTYYRNIRARTVNGDVNQNSLDQSVYQPSAADQAALRAAGYTGFPNSGASAANTPFPFWRCIAQVLQRDEPAEKCTGLIHRTFVQQQNYGMAAQLIHFAAAGRHRNQFTGGGAWDHSASRFTQSAQLGYLNPDRGITGVNAFGDGTTGGNINGVPYDTRADLDGRVNTGSAFLTDTFSLGNVLHFTASGRYNRTTLSNRDFIHPGGGPESLDGQDVYGRFNPAVGVTYQPRPSINLYFGYTEGSRAPTSIELGCANPNQPCKLPNALAGDPPLRQVVTRTLEAGIRSSTEQRLHWNIGWFRAENYDDLLFVASTQTGFGYFKNFGQTRRQGLQADLSTRIKRVTTGAGYTLLSAAYETAEILQTGSNSSSNADGNVNIQPGDRIPLVPRNMLKAFANVQMTSKLSVDADLLALSGAYARGNENNQHQPDGVYYLGPGTSPGYAIVNLGGRYVWNKRLEFFAQVNNLFDRHHDSGAQLGPTAFTSSGTYLARPFPAVNGQFPLQYSTFFAPGAPIGAWGGLRFKF